MKIKILIASAVLAAAFLTADASAFQGFVSNSVNLRAGPGKNYPVVARVSANRPLLVNGCLERRDWCEVESGPFRGWVSSRYLEADYGNRHRGYIADLGPAFEVPLINFEIVSYWNTYYRDRPFYKERKHWKKDWDDDRNHKEHWDNRDHDKDKDHRNDNDHWDNRDHDRDHDNDNDHGDRNDHDNWDRDNRSYDYPHGHDWDKSRH